MELTFNQVEAIFAERFDVPTDRMVAFRGRLQHLQRLNFPDGVNTGRGKKASYGWKQVIQLMIALDLIDLGLTPDTAIKRVRQSTNHLIAGIYRVVCKLENITKLSKAIAKERCPFTKTEFVLSFAGLLSFSHSEDQDGGYLMVISGPVFHQTLSDFEKYPEIAPAAAYIDLGARTMLIANRVGRLVHPDPQETAADLEAWLGSQVHQDTLS